MEKQRPAADLFARLYDLSILPDATAQPIITLTDLILEEALSASAARLHVAPLAQDIGSVRFFVQDDWNEVLKFPGCSRVVNRLKIMANLDITKKGRQEGTVHLRMKTGTLVDLPILTNASVNKAQEAFLDCPLHAAP